MGAGAHTQHGPGPSVTGAAALARFRARSPRWRGRRAARWPSVRLPGLSLWFPRPPTPEVRGRSGRSLTGETTVVGVTWGRRGDRRRARAAAPPSAGNRKPGPRRVRAGPRGAGAAAARALSPGPAGPRPGTGREPGRRARGPVGTGRAPQRPRAAVAWPAGPRARLPVRADRGGRGAALGCRPRAPQRPVSAEPRLVLLVQRLRHVLLVSWRHQLDFSTRNTRLKQSRLRARCHVAG